MEGKHTGDVSEWLDGWETISRYRSKEQHVGLKDEQKGVVMGEGKLTLGMHKMRIPMRSPLLIAHCSMEEFTPGKEDPHDLRRPQCLHQQAMLAAAYVLLLPAQATEVLRLPARANMASNCPSS